MIDAPHFDPTDSSSHAWRSRGGIVRIAAALFPLVLVIVGLIVVLVQRFPLKRTTVATPSTATSTKAQPSENNLPIIPPRPTVASLLTEPIARLVTQEADLDGDGLDELTFIAIGNAESKGGEVDLSSWNAMIGVIAYDRTDQQWRLTHQEAVGGVSGTEAVELFATTDLDQDTHPEIIYSLHLSGSGQFREWAVLSSRDGRLQKTATTDFAYDRYGFQGHNRVTLAPARLIEETFPIYKADDPNCCATGGTERLLFRFDGMKILLERAEKSN